MALRRKTVTLSARPIAIANPKPKRKKKPVKKSTRTATKPVKKTRIGRAKPGSTARLPSATSTAKLRYPYVIIDGRKQVRGSSKTKAVADKKLKALRATSPNATFRLVKVKAAPKKKATVKKAPARKRTVARNPAVKKTKIGRAKTRSTVKLPKTTSAAKLRYPYAIIDGRKKVRGSSRTKANAEKRLKALRAKHPKTTFRLTKVSAPAPKKAPARKKSTALARKRTGSRLTITLDRYYPYAIIDGQKKVQAKSLKLATAKKTLAALRAKEPRATFRLVKVAKG